MLIIEPSKPGYVWTYDGAGTIVGRQYPERIVDLKSSTVEAKDKIYGARGSAGFDRDADDIQSRHGSRKSGIPMRGGNPDKRKRGSNASSSDQLKFDL